MLTLEKVASTLFGAFDSSIHDDVNESARKYALFKAVPAMAEIELLGLKCGIFGSAMRPGDFFNNSDVDFAIWNDDLSLIGSEQVMRARMACHFAMGQTPFDLVCLPSSNHAFTQRILHSWARDKSEALRSAQGDPLDKPILFGPSDVAFIDADRIAIAQRASTRIALHAQGNQWTSNPGRSILSLCASMQTIVRVAEKCAKDALREFAKIRPSRCDNKPLYPLLAYPCEALGGLTFARPESVSLYFECCDLLDMKTDQPLTQDRVTRMVLTSMLFTAALSCDFEPALHAMRAIR
jgi:hypothetical protein